MRLTDPEHGVDFDLNNDGIPERLSWTRAGTNQGFLVLDRNSNGVIDDGTELFGDFTPQSTRRGEERNGFAALRVLDEQALGGNGDGFISEEDAVFADLRLWVDWNHDGVSQQAELGSLLDAGVLTIDLNYVESRRRDRYGNEFRYFSFADALRGEAVRHLMLVDVFFQTAR
ncbi:MAG TPA: hypothetical protein VLU25_10370 [Acidobacteriota bacterium]|nr:hypothetical protein [Acidobacteriota bacterium]